MDRRDAASEETVQRAVEAAIRIGVVALLGLWVFQIIAPVAAGVVIGVAASLWFGRLAEAQLFQLKAHDPLMLGASALTVIVAAILASYAPAYSASRGDPLRSLRQE